MAGGRPPVNMVLSRLRALKTALLATAHALGDSSPEEVLAKFVDMVQNASPQLKLVILFLTPWTMLIRAVSQYHWIRQICSSVKSYITDSLYASVSIPGTHPLNKQILAYMVEHGLGKNARTLALTQPNATGDKNYSAMLDEYLYGGGAQRTRAKRNLNAEEEDRQKQALAYVPEIGKYRFWWRWLPMTFERQRHSQEHYDSKGRLTYTSTLSGNEDIVISCPSLLAGPKPIQEFLDYVKAVPAKDNTTTIYRPDGQNLTWDAGITRPSRNLNAVTLDAVVKDGLIKDVENYLAPETRKWYSNRGIPWRRGLLFYGNPGTGKTSFVNALAGHLNLNIYMISLSSKSLSDSIVETLFEQLPLRCIVLLEDIDSAGILRENMREKADKSHIRKQRQRYDVYGNAIPRTAATRVTLSGLLNVLDGIHSKEGTVCIMTSNSPDSLDPALIRPGRIDRKVLFGYASTEVIKKLFIHIFSRAPEELREGERMEQNGHEIASLADTFADMVPPNELTPAEVQGFLLVHRDDPALAVEKAAAWAMQTVSTKEKGVNVESFAGQNRTDAKNCGTKPSSKSTNYTTRAVDAYVDPTMFDDQIQEEEDFETTSNPYGETEQEGSSPPSPHSSNSSLDEEEPADSLAAVGNAYYAAASTGLPLPTAVSKQIGNPVPSFIVRRSPCLVPSDTRVLAGVGDSMKNPVTPKSTPPNPQIQTQTQTPEPAQQPTNPETGAERTPTSPSAQALIPTQPQEERQKKAKTKRK